MTSKTLTDKHGDVITISGGGLTLATPGHVLVHVKETTRGRVHAAAAYADPAQLRAALDEVAPAGSYTRTDEEDWQARAEKAEQDRDEARSDARRASERWRKELTLRLEVADELRRLRATQARPLTPDAITDEMVERAVNAYATRRWNDGAEGYLSHKHNDAMREALTLALTEPPKRPDWQDLADVLRDIGPAEALSIDELAEAAHERGVRVVGGEDPPMTADDFTEAARAEAERRHPAPETETGTQLGYTQTEIGEVVRRTFTNAAEWARTHLAAQEPTAAEVEAAAIECVKFLFLTAPERPWENPEVVKQWEPMARAALSAARAARRDEEKR